MNAVALAALVDAGIKLVSAIVTAAAEAQATLSEDELAPLQAQLATLHAKSLDLSAQVDAAALAASKI